MRSWGDTRISEGREEEATGEGKIKDTRQNVGFLEEKRKGIAW